jgi:hypothetical protein
MQREAELIHAAGARFGYLLTSGLVPLAELILQSGVDAIIGIDPGEGKGTTLGEVASTFGGRVGLWGGVSGPLVVEEGEETEVRAAVEEAVAALAPTGRFILCPVDNVRADTARAWRNVKVFVATWKALSKES